MGAGGALGAGALAATGFNMLAVAVAAFTLILMGLFLLRWAMVRRRPAGEGATPAGSVDAVAALAAALAVADGGEPR